MTHQTPRHHEPPTPWTWIDDLAAATTGAALAALILAALTWWAP